MIRERFEENGHTRFFHNIDAVLCRIWLYMDDLERVQVWYREKAPKDPLHLNVLKRYQYLTQAMAELATRNARCSTFDTRTIGVIL